MAAMATPRSATAVAGRESHDRELDEDDLKILFEALLPMAEKYLFFGININVKMSEITNIQKQCTDPKECLLKVLSIRLRQIPSLTWKDIYTALKSDSVSEGKLADRIMKKYVSPDPIYTAKMFLLK